MQVSARTITILTGAAVAVACAAYATGRRHGARREQRLNIARYRWKNRVLLVFAPDDASAMFQTQMAHLATRTQDVHERDLIVIPVLANGKAGDINRRDAAMLREAYSVPKRTFCAILIGKDGTVKRRDEHPLNVDRLFEVIDAMPMRRMELATKGRG